MEPAARFPNFGHPAIRREQRVHGSPKRIRGPACGDDGADRHSERVDPGIGTTRRVHPDGMVQEAQQHRLDFALHRSRVRLYLPASEASAVIVETGEDRPVHHAEI